MKYRINCQTCGCFMYECDEDIKINHNTLIECVIAMGKKINQIDNKGFDPRNLER